MASPHEACTQHSGIMGRLNLMIALLVVAIGFVGSTYVSINGKLADLERTVAVTAVRSEEIAKSLEQAWKRINHLEGIK